MGRKIIKTDELRRDESHASRRLMEIAHKLEDINREYVGTLLIEEAEKLKKAVSSASKLAVQLYRKYYD